MWEVVLKSSLTVYLLEQRKWLIVEQLRKLRGDANNKTTE